MAEYDINFAARFSDVAQATIAGGLTDVEAQRVVVYISRVSIELTLKALLERAGVPPGVIRAHSHRLRDLLAELDKCEVEVEIAPGTKRWLSASRLRSVTVQIHGMQIPVGMVIEAEEHGASTYPNELRYGAVPKDFPVEAVAAAAEATAAWAKEQWNSVRRPSDV